MQLSRGFYAYMVTIQLCMLRCICGHSLVMGMGMGIGMGMGVGMGMGCAY